jgi:hypothetical protein
MSQEVERVSTAPPIYVPSEGSTWQQLTKSPWLVLGILFFVTGALGLPLLWSSPSFSTNSKWFWSIVVSVYTVLLIAIVVAIVWWAFATISNAGLY